MYSRQFWIALVITAALSFLGGSVSGLAEWAGFGRSARALAVVDGDTIKLGTQSLRLAGIDAPEVSRPDCAAEAALGARATERLRALMAEGQIAILPTGRADRFGRPLIALTVDGRDAGQALMSEGLAQPWPRRAPWCPAGS
jgi:micrococcal nuclease